ncbi:MAG: thiol:disulfide interchange protein DsbA/DsbL [Burkholderiales bacterium]|jgi:thiol:disulfide interchange protein DsbA|nr:thiol:disulfide interchange protein DsbA/DsbL [Burkholderiales bacterium]
MKIVSPFFSRGAWPAALLSVFAWAALSLPSSAWAAATEGKEYTQIAPQTTEASKGKIEVIEFFSYLCPHCADFNPKVEEWKKTLPSDVVFHKIPVNWGRTQWSNMSRAYYALEAIGEESRMSPMVFNAIHRGELNPVTDKIERINLTEEKIFLDWAEKKGVDRQKLEGVYGSFAINSKVMQSDEKAKNYKVQSVPSFYVDGRYAVNVEEAIGKGLGVVDEVIAIARKDAKKK